MLEMTDFKTEMLIAVSAKLKFHQQIKIIFKDFVQLTFIWVVFMFKFGTVFTSKLVISSE